MKTPQPQSASPARRTAKQSPAIDQWLEAAFSLGTADYERRQICSGTEVQIRQKLERLAAPRKSYGLFPKPYEHFTRLVVGIEVAEQQFPGSGLAEKLFGEARKLFEIPEFDIHHIAPERRENQLSLLRSYIAAFQRYAPAELERGLPAIIRQHCTDLTFFSGLGESVESILGGVSPERVKTLGRAIVSEMIRQKLYIRTFALSRLTLSAMGDPEQRATVIGRLEECAALLKRFGTQKQQDSLQKAALAALRERGEGGLADRVKEVLKHVFPAP